MKIGRSGLNDPVFMTHQAPIWFVDETAAHILGCNTAACSLLGLPEDQIVRLSPTEIGLMRGKERSRIMISGSMPAEVGLSWHAAVWADSPALMVMAKLTPEAGVRGQRVVAVPAAEGTGEARHGNVDITTFATSAERQRRAESLLDLASGMAKLGGWRADLQTGLLEATRGAHAVYAIPADMPFDRDAVLSCFAPVDRTRLVEAGAAVLRNKETFEGEFAITALDGTAKWVRTSQAPEIGPDGTVIALVGAVQDITETVMLRSEAEARALRLKSTIRNMPDAFFLFNLKLQFVYANPAGCAMLGMQLAQREELMGKSLWDVRPDLEPVLRVLFDGVLATGNPVSTVVEIKGLKSIRRVNAHATADGIGVHVRDVTDEVQAQRSLLENEERYRLAFKASRDVLYEWNIPEDVLTWSEAARESFGYHPAVFPRNIADWLSILHHADRDRMQQAADVSRGMGQQDVLTAQYRMLRADGSTAHVLDRSLTIQDAEGRPLRMIGTITDVSDIHEEGLRLRAIADVAADAIYEFDPKRNVVIFSEGMRTTFGHAWVGEQTVPTPWQAVIHPDDREARVAGSREFAEGDAHRARYEYRMMRADGSYAMVRERVVAIRDEDDRLVWLVGSIEDITAERRVEERIKRAERSEAIGNLTGGVAHDFNNLLTVILGNAEVLESIPGLADEDRELASIIVRAAERGAELTAGLLAFAGQQPLTPQALDMHVALAEVGRLLERTLPADIALKIAAQPDLWLVEADAAQINAAILNLAVNARDAMPGGGKLLIECANARLDDAYVAENPDAAVGDFLRIAVTDTGTGIDKAVLEHVFEPFFTTKPKGTGSGMGLSMVGGFVQQSGGHVKIYTEVGHGTTISLYLPRSFAGHAESGPDIVLVTPLGRGEHVLIVEDNALLLPHVAETVAALGYRISTASNAAEALVILQGAGDVDVLFTDVVMPGEMNGPALAKLAKQIFPGLKVLFTSGYTENAIVHHGRLDHGVQLLSKPYRRLELATKLRTVIDDAS